MARRGVGSQGKRSHTYHAGPRREPSDLCEDDIAYVVRLFLWFLLGALLAHCIREEIVCVDKDAFIFVCPALKDRYCEG